MAKYTITPWRTQADLLEVRQQLYSLAIQSSKEPNPTAESSKDARRYAVNRVMAWKQRGSNLPHAVESTALLVDAILHHTNATASTSNSPFSIRAVYSAAFCRFVTGFCDIGRAKERSLEPSSMLVIAKQIGMPAEFVALRHEATHEELPAIQRLVVATRQALEWLWKVYWSRLDESDDAAMSIQAVRDESRTVLRSFRSARRAALKAGKQGTQAHAEDMANTRSICTKLCAGSMVKMEAFVDVMVDDNLLVPSTRELGSSMEGAFLLWDELLAGLQAKQPSLLPTLVKKMLNTISQDSTADAATDTSKEALCLWLLRFLDSEISPGSQATVERLQSSAMRWYCLHPGYWTQRLGEEILGNGDEHFDDQWRTLFDASKLDVTAAQADADVMEIEPSTVGGLDDECESRGWVRAAVPMRTPIGVV
ncbi:Hypothetical protein R9X50_00234400 [Acrodontium crateriforme]|uniref:Las1-domain-containing protein n=1 Tax=Acrodontium crateriforme TaxID=150365 RepID=A0AAQ3M0Z6_9PEZI|nr:Hypothetical protein R9X50_00234400 [Acrodontium crateriforme]